MKKDNSYSFSLSLRGEQIHDSIDGVDLGESILAFTQIISTVSEQEFGLDLMEDLHIQVTGFEPGSFISKFQIFLKSASATLPILGVENVKDIIDSTVAIFDIKKHLKGKPAKKVETSNQPGAVIIQNNENSKIIVNKNSYHYSQNPTISAQAEKLVAPLVRENGTVEEIAILKENKDELSSVSKEEAEYFDSSDLIVENEDTIETTSQELISVLSMAMKEGGKWRFKAMQETFYASIEDMEFLKKMEDEKVSNLQYLLVDMKTTEHAGKKVRVVQKVLKYFGNIEQMQIDIEE